MRGRGGFGAMGWGFVFLGFMGKRKASVRALGGGKMGSDLTDDDGVSEGSRLDDVDAEAFVRRAVPLADMSLDAPHLTPVVDVIIAEIAFNRVARGVRHEVMGAQLPQEVRPGHAQPFVFAAVPSRMGQIDQRLVDIVGVEIMRFARGLDGPFMENEPRTGGFRRRAGGPNTGSGRSP